jgi:flagellum-specific ATP synthase
MPAVCGPEHLAKVQRLRRLLADFTRSEDLIRIGAYQKGTDPDLDRAIAVVPQLKSFARQGPAEIPTLDVTLERLMGLAD